MTMGLTGTRRCMTVEEPQAIRVSLDVGDRLPISHGKPPRLGLPLLCDQQDMGWLHGVLVQQQQVAAPELFHLKPRIPRQKRIGAWARTTQVLGRSADQSSHQKRIKP